MGRHNPSRRILPRREKKPNVPPTLPAMQDLTPRQIVAELDRYIIGQADAKRAVAVAIRNRWRRQQLDEELAREVQPKNIIMSGPTGVGKTEIARRLAKLTAAPFVKVEASKFTEVGYHGRDVESMIRDLLDVAVGLVRDEQGESVRERAQANATDRLVDLLLPTGAAGVNPSAPDDDQDDSDAAGVNPSNPSPPSGMTPTQASGERRERIRGRIRESLLSGKLDDKEVEIDLSKKPKTGVLFAGMGLDQMDPQMAGMLENLMPQQNKRRRLSVAEARRLLIEEETDKLLDTDKITQEAIHRTEQGGIVFLDEIDKVATPGGSGGGGRGGGGPDVSRQGVQRDLLPIVEGSAVTTRYGVVNTDHILFIAAGAFHSAAVSDLMPELQGRFPIRVELSALTEADFVRILTEPKNALTKQQQALLGVEGLEVTFDDDAVQAIADLAARANATMENIGARRLMTVVEQVFDGINFDAPETVASGQTSLTITGAFVRERVAGVFKDEDLSRFVL